MDEICQYPGVSDDRIHSWILKKNMPATTPGHIWRFKRDRVDKNVDVEIPLHRIIGIAGVSGSGKSSLALGCFMPRGLGGIWSRFRLIPGGGESGGRIVASGTLDAVKCATESVTAKFL